MSTVINLLALAALLAGLVALIHLVRHDRLAGNAIRYVPRDELGPLAFRRRPA